MSHRIVNPPELLAPRGFAHAVVAGRTVYLGGQTAHDRDGTVVGTTLADQFDRALANLVTALEAAGAQPEHLVSLQLFVTDAAEYRGAAKELGAAWRRHLGRHYPAMALLEVSALADRRARVEIMGIAVVPE